MTAAIETHKLTKWYSHRSRGVAGPDQAYERFDPGSGHGRPSRPACHRPSGRHVPGELSLYGDLTGRQLLTYLGNLQGSVDDVAAISGRVPTSIFQEG